MKALMDLMEGKGKKEKKMGEMDVSAKMGSLKELHKIMMDKAGKDIADGLQKITVMAKDKEGLEKGLEKAKELLEKMPEPENMEQMLEGKKKEDLEVNGDEEEEYEEED